MYSNGVRRTQIYLDDEESGLLDRAAEQSGASRSELIRRAVRAQYGQPGSRERLAALRASAGIWRDRTETGAEFVESARGDLNDRLRELGTE
jgi:metal-responsive CopG/Arc/MetJ family transcriptional regulator